MANFLKKLVPVDDLKVTINRFQEASFCVFLLFTLVFCSIHDLFDIDRPDTLLGRLMILSGVGFFWFTAARLMAESLGWDKTRHMLVGGVVFIALGVGMLCLSGPQLIMFTLLILGALLLLLNVAPYLRSRDDLSLWFFNRTLQQGKAVAALAGILWGAGLSGALFSLNALFDIRVDGEIYADIWAFSLLLFAPLYGLSWTPERFTFTEADCTAPPQLAFVLNWVLAPLVLIYSLILYAYLGKILITQEMPRGILAYMITIYGVVGVTTYLSGWPLREAGGPLLRFVYKFFFPALIIPVVMLFVSIGLRIEQYGVTPQRYMIVLGALWLGILAVLYTVRIPPLKTIMMLLAALFVIASIGPLSVLSVSVWSQKMRLETLLAKNNILVNAQITPVSNDTVSGNDKAEIGSILEILDDWEKREAIDPWLPQPLGEMKKGEHYATVAMKAMGLEYSGRHARLYNNEARETFSIQGQNEDEISGVTATDGYDFIIPHTYVEAASKRWTKSWKRKGDPQDKAPFMEIIAQDGVIEIRAEGRPGPIFDLASLAEAEYNKDPGNGPREMVLEQSNENMRVRLKIGSLRGNIQDGKPVVTAANFELYLSLVP